MQLFCQLNFNSGPVHVTDCQHVHKQASNGTGTSGSLHIFASICMQGGGERNQQKSLSILLILGIWYVLCLIAQNTRQETKGLKD